MMKKTILILLITVGIAFSANIPVLTINHETGTRYEYDPSENEDNDLQTYDSYQFNKGYAQFDEDLNKNLKLKYQIFYSFKNYELSTNLDNATYTHKLGFGWKINKQLDMDFGFNFADRNFPQADLKNNHAYAPMLGISFDPTKKIKLGLTYNFIAQDYDIVLGNYLGNRGALVYEHKIIPEVNLRLKYKIENRNFEVTSAQRQDSFKQSFSATVKIDLNKSK